MTLLVVRKVITISNADDIGLLNESDSNTEINFASILKIYPGPSDISHNISYEPTQLNLTFYPKAKYGNRWHHFSKQWFKTFPWLEYSKKSFI